VFRLSNDALVDLAASELRGRFRQCATRCAPRLVVREPRATFSLAPASRRVRRRARREGLSLAGDWSTQGCGDDRGRRRVGHRAAAAALADLNARRAAQQPPALSVGA